MIPNALVGIINISASGLLSLTNSIIEAQNGNVSGKNGACQTLTCTGIENLISPDSRGIFMGLDSNFAAGIDICADTDQHIDFYNYE